jgi:hypothetical protein
MSSFIYYDKLNNLARTYRVEGNKYLIKDARNFKTDYENVINEIGEALLYYDGIAINVYGENIPLAILVNVFGVKGVEELIDQKSIEFVLDNAIITYLVTDSKGINPLQYGNLNSEAHCDPEKSATLGLEWLSNKLPRRVRRNLIRKVTKIYKVPSPDLAKDAVEFGHEGYNSNLFSDLGLPKEKDLTNLNKRERSKLCNFASQCLKLAILSQFKYDTLDLFDIAKISHQEINRLSSAKVIEKNTDKLFNVEKLPDFKELIKEGVISLDDIPKLRGKKDSKRFRLWISKVSSNDGKEDIIKEYVDAIDRKSIFETKIGKAVKTLGVWGLTTTLETKLSGSLTEGAIIGGMADLGISLLDTYMLDGILKGWNPRHYFNNGIKPLVNKK